MRGPVSFGVHIGTGLASSSTTRAMSSSFTVRRRRLAPQHSGSFVGDHQDHDSTARGIWSIEDELDAYDVSTR
jgi:hypothetical protein